MPGRMARNGRTGQGRTQSTRRGQALVETALVIPVLLLLAFGVVGVGRLTRAQMGVSAVAREAAVAATRANTADEAWARGMSRGTEVAGGYHLNNGSLQLSVEPGGFARGGQVRAAASYMVTLDDLPLMGWVQVPVDSDHIERIDLHRSRWFGTGER